MTEQINVSTQWVDEFVCINTSPVHLLHAYPVPLFRIVKKIMNEQNMS